MAILVIGGCGFIGSHIVAELEADARDVIVLDRHGDVSPMGSRARYIHGDFGNAGDLERIFQEYAISEVIHLAGSTVPGNSNRDPQFDVTTNVCATIGLLDISTRYRVRKVIFLSSGGAVYGIPHHPVVTENHPTDPISSYGITKLTIEKYLKLYKHLHGLDYVVIRAANPYGPGQRPSAEQGVIGVFMWRAMNGAVLDLWGDGSVVRDYFHVNDLARLCVKALTSQTVGVFNAGSGIGRSLREVIDAIEQCVGVRARVSHMPARAADVPRIVLDSTLARKTFEWQPHVDFDEGLAETKAWLQREFKLGG